MFLVDFFKLPVIFNAFSFKTFCTVVIFIPLQTEVFQGKNEGVAQETRPRAYGNHPPTTATPPAVAAAYPTAGGHLPPISTSPNQSESERPSEHQPAVPQGRIHGRGGRETRTTGVCEREPGAQIEADPERKAQHEHHDQAAGSLARAQYRPAEVHQGVSVEETHHENRQFGAEVDRGVQRPDDPHQQHPAADVADPVREERLH